MSYIRMCFFLTLFAYSKLTYTAIVYLTTAASRKLPLQSPCLFSSTLHGGLVLQVENPFSSSVLAPSVFLRVPSQNLWEHLVSQPSISMKLASNLPRKTVSPNKSTAPLPRTDPGIQKNNFAEPKTVLPLRWPPSTRRTALISFSNVLVQNPVSRCPST